MIWNWLAGSSVTLQGNYYGYNFQKNYGAQDPDSAKKAEFSSAMMVNGKSSHLDIKGLNYLLLAGRTFISRKLDASNEDILMGESISARTNQLAYYVPLEYVSRRWQKSGSKEVCGIYRNQ